MQETSPAARIILEDGTEFEGVSFGHESSVSGEIVFYTGAAGLPTLLTDPALKGCILVLSQPLAGATGVCEDKTDPWGFPALYEALSAQAAGLVTADYADLTTHHSASRTLSKWLRKQQVPAIHGIDTRALIQRLRLRGTMRAKILVSGTREVSFSSSSTHNQPSHVSVKKTLTYGKGPKRVVLVDCGARLSAVRRLSAEDTTVVRVPCTHDFNDEPFDAVMVSGGPGDPTSCDKTVQILRKAIDSGKPVFATGQGAVILAIAGGAAAYRMSNGHRSSAVPCVHLENGRCYVTAQNHGYGIRDDSLPAGWTPLFLNDNDRSIEGFSAKKGLITGVLFHPEGNPGPRDTDFLYDDFLKLLRNGGITE